MANTFRSNCSVAMISLALATMLVHTVSVSGQQAGSSEPVIQDWTYHHVVYSDPGSAQDAIRAGQYDRWLRIVNDPHYIMQQRIRARQAATAPTSSEAGLVGGASQAKAWGDPTAPSPVPETTAESEIGLAPIVETTLEQRDMERGNRLLPLGLSRALISPSRMMQPEGLAPGGPNIGPNHMKKDWSEDLGSGASVGLGEFPATYVTSMTSCTADFAIFNTGLTGSSTQASIVAYNELYASCSSSPSTYWAYYDTTGGTITNSVDLSLDGTQVGFVETNGSGVAELALLKWTSCTGCSVTAPVGLTPVGASSYRTCTAPCMTTLTLSGSPSDTYSFPYYDPNTDAIYVGDDAGKLHKFTNIFLSGQPTEAGSPWPKQLPTAANESALGSPVYDTVTSQVFVGDYLLNTTQSCEPSANTTIGSCGYLYSVNSSGTVTVSHELDYNIGILDSPIVDPTAGSVYAFVGDDGSSNCSVNTVSGFPCAGVFQFPVGFSGGATGTEATVGPGYEFMMSGAFDNAYLISNNETGHMYVVGNTGPANNTLYQLAINNNVLSTTSTAGPAVATNYSNYYYAAGLQVTEFYNSTIGGGTDNIFTSNFNSSSTPTGGLSEAGGTSGIVVDSGTLNESNIYFSTLLNQSCTTSGGTGGCAVQTTQAAP